MKKTVYESPWMKLAVDAKAKTGTLVVNGVLGHMPAAAGAEAKGGTLVIDGIIGSYDWSADTWKEAQALRQEQFRKDLQALAEAKVDELVIEISSLGGNFAHALAMHDFLAQYPGKVTTRVIGMTASSATILAQAGRVRQISANVLYLIHRSTNYAYGNATALRSTLADLEAIDGRMADIYAKRAGKTPEAMLSVMDEHNAQGVWMPASRVVELGLADEVFEPMAAAACSELVERAACAMPRASSFLALGLPVPPTPSTGSEPSAEQTQQLVAGAKSATKPETATASKGSRPMLTPDQVKQLHGLFGAEVAVAAVAEGKEFDSAILAGAEAQSKALADSRSQVQALTGERDDLTGKLAQANAQVEAHKQGLIDPLAAHTQGTPGAEEEAKKKAEAEADASKRSGLSAYAQSTNPK